MRRNNSFIDVLVTKRTGLMALAGMMGLTPLHVLASPDAVSGYHMQGEPVISTGPSLDGGFGVMVGGEHDATYAGETSYVYVHAMDEDGNFLFDAEGNPITERSRDEHGNYYRVPVNPIIRPVAGPESVSDVLSVHETGPLQFSQHADSRFDFQERLAAVTLGTHEGLWPFWNSGAHFSVIEQGGYRALSMPNHNGLDIRLIDDESLNVQAGDTLIVSGQFKPNSATTSGQVFFRAGGTDNWGDNLQVFNGVSLADPFELSFTFTQADIDRATQNSQEWQGTVLRMGTNNAETYGFYVTNIAVVPPVLTGHALTVSGGTATVDGEAVFSAQAGTQVTLTATPGTREQFLNWQITPTLTLTAGSLTTAVATFIMPDSPVTIVGNMATGPLNFTLQEVLTTAGTGLPVGTGLLQGAGAATFAQVAVGDELFLRMDGRTADWHGLTVQAPPLTLGDTIRVSGRTSPAQVGTITPSLTHPNSPWANWATAGAIAPGEAFVIEHQLTAADLEGQPGVRLRTTTGNHPLYIYDIEITDGELPAPRPVPAFVAPILTVGNYVEVSLGNTSFVGGAVEAGTIVTVTARPDLAEDNRTFVNWVVPTDVAVTGELTSPTISFVMPDSHMTIAADWSVPIPADLGWTGNEVGYLFRATEMFNQLGADATQAELGSVFQNAGSVLSLRYLGDRLALHVNRTEADTWRGVDIHRTHLRAGDIVTVNGSQRLTAGSSVMNFTQISSPWSNAQTRTVNVADPNFTFSVILTPDMITHGSWERLRINASQGGVDFYLTEITFYRPIDTTVNPAVGVVSEADFEAALEGLNAGAQGQMRRIFANLRDNWFGQEVDNNFPEDVDENTLLIPSDTGFLQIPTHASMDDDIQAQLADMLGAFILPTLELDSGTGVGVQFSNISWWGLTRGGQRRFVFDIYLLSNPTIRVGSGMAVVHIWPHGPVVGMPGGVERGGRFTRPLVTQPVQVTFNPAGGSFRTLTPQVVTLQSGLSVHQMFNTGLVAQVNHPSREGFTFRGWYIGDTRMTMHTPVTSDLTAVARWNLRPGFELPADFETYVPDVGEQFVFSQVLFASDFSDGRPWQLQDAGNPTETVVQVNGVPALRLGGRSANWHSVDLHRDGGMGMQAGDVVTISGRSVDFPVGSQVVIGSVTAPWADVPGGRINVEGSEDWSITFVVDTELASAANFVRFRIHTNDVAAHSDLIITQILVGRP